MADRMFEEVSRSLDVIGGTGDEIILSRVPDYIIVDVTDGSVFNPLTNARIEQGEHISWEDTTGRDFNGGVTLNGNVVEYGYYSGGAYVPTLTIKAYIGQVMIDDITLSNIADAIRAKTGTNKKYLPSEMAEAIYAISGDNGALINDEDDDAVIINFSIEGYDFQAEEGMTWREWVNSEYNDGACVYNAGEDSIRFVEYSLNVLSPSNTPVKGSDTIIANYFYYLS